MARIVIPYASGAGHTRRLAALIASTSGGIPMDVEARVDWDVLHAAQAIVFGAPTYMGSASAAFKAFMDATSDFWLDQPWRDKIAAGFTVGSANSGDKANTLVQFATLAAQHGMIWVGQAEIGQPARDTALNGDGFWLGLGVTASRDKTELIPPAAQDTARAFGQRVAYCTTRWG